MAAVAVKTWGLTNRDGWKMNTKKIHQAPALVEIVQKPITIVSPVLPAPLAPPLPGELKPVRKEEQTRTEGVFKIALGKDDNYMRMNMLKTLRDTCPDIWQQHVVPLDKCERMLDAIPHTENTLYVVLYSIEFVETLVRTKGINPRQVIFFADHDLMQNAAKKMYGMQESSWRLSQEYLCSDVDFNYDGLTDLLEEDIENMKFDKLVVIGNPPYQQMDGGGNENTTPSAMPIYHKFVEAILDNLKPDYLTFIIPSRWMVGGKGLDKFRARMLDDTHIKSIVHFPGESEVFESVRIQGGVNYFLWDKTYDGPCAFTVGGVTKTRYLNEYDIVLQDNEAQSILEKVRSIHTGDWMSSKVLSRKPFGLPANFSDWKESGTPCYSMGKKVYYCDKESFTDKSNVLDKWKVLIPNVGDPRNPRIFSHSLVIKPGEICTETYLVVSAFETEGEALSCERFIQTRFFRFLLTLRKVTQHINKDKFAWVPDVGDYTKEWTDSELYAMFDLTADEQAYIDGKIKPLL